MAHGMQYGRHEKLRQRGSALLPDASGVGVCSHWTQDSEGRRNAKPLSGQNQTADRSGNSIHHVHGRGATLGQRSRAMIAMLTATTTPSVRL
jgi:hypothetical protein